MDTDIKIRTIDVWIDDFTPCLKDRMTGEVVNTEVVCIRRKSFLSKFNKKSGWYVNLHPYQFCVFEDKMQEIIKTYTYAYSREEI